jgi:hypothetical protein
MVERVRITPSRIITRRDSSAISFDTNNKYLKTTTSGNLKTERLMNSPLVQVSTGTSGNSIVDVSSSGILLAMLHRKDMEKGTLIRIPDSSADTLTLKITFGFRTPWFPTGTPFWPGTPWRSSYYLNTSIFLTTYDANGAGRNFLIADNLKRHVSFITTPFSFIPSRNTYDYSARWTYGTANEQVLSLEVNNVVPGSSIWVPPLINEDDPQGYSAHPGDREYFNLAPLCFYIRQNDIVETGLGISP